jgi:hypothetical protein
MNDKTAAKAPRTNRLKGTFRIAKSRLPERAGRTGENECLPYSFSSPHQ